MVLPAAELSGMKLLEAMALVLGACVATQAVARGAEECCVKVDTSTRQLVDVHGMRSLPLRLFVYTSAVFSAGRARIFHGLNVVSDASAA